MSDPFLPYYERELAVLRQRAAEFAREHPKVAARLSLGHDESRDPHVERLLQGVAYLNARIHERLDDDFPELSDTLLDLLYPHYLRPVPSMTIVEMEIDRKQAGLVAGHRVPRGTVLETESVGDETCLYRTCFELDLWPLEVRGARVTVPPFDLPTAPPARAEALLQVELASFAPTVPVGQMPIDRLRFHLHLGIGQSILALYELILTKCLGVLVEDPASGKAMMLPPRAITASGFDHDDAALPADARTSPGYRLLSEAFTLPQRFLFIDVQGLNGAIPKDCGPNLRLSFILTESHRELERLVTASAVRLGCTPVVNLFSQRLDPLRTTGTESEYCLTPDARRPAALEVYSLLGVRAGGPGERPRAVLPLYGQSSPITVSRGGEFEGLRYAAVRRIRREPRPDGTVDTGSDVWISLIDPLVGPTAIADLTVHAEALCTNRNVTNMLPFTVDRPRLTLRDGVGPVGRIACLARPTRPLRHQPGRGTAWRLISHLSLNHLSLVDQGDGQAAAALRQMLTLYLHDDLDDYAQKQRWIQGISRISGRRVAARVPGIGGGIAQGCEVELELDDERFADHAGFLFASLIERLLASHVTINSFTRLVATSRQRDSRKEPWRWPPRTGSRVLV